MYEVYAELHQDNPYFDMNSNALNFPVKTLGYDSELDSVVIKSGHFQTVEMRSSRQVKVPYAANICPHCGAFQGRYHILEEVTDRFLKPNTPMDIECEL